MKAPRRLKRGAFLVPSLLTTANMALGFYALVEAVQGYTKGLAGAAFFDRAALAIGWAVLFALRRSGVHRLSEMPDATLRK